MEGMFSDLGETYNLWAFWYKIIVKAEYDGLLTRYDISVCFVRVVVS